MSQFPPARDFTLDNEDATRTYAISKDSNGFPVVAGINARYWPSFVEDIVALPQQARASLVSDFYLNHYWAPARLGGLVSQDLSNRVFDQGVNGGLVEAVKLLQQAYNQTPIKAATQVALAVDGALGPLTLTAVNSIDTERIVAAYRQQRVVHMERVIAADPSLLSYKTGLLLRASK